MAAMRQVSEGVLTPAAGACGWGGTRHHLRRLTLPFGVEGDGAAVHGLCRDRKSNRARRSCTRRAAHGARELGMARKRSPLASL